MRTKTLVIAAAALAAGLISSQAQVYSQNVVGYANITADSPYANYCLACQFSMGASNGLNEVFSSPLPDTSVVLIWNVSGQSYDSYTADSGVAAGWDDANGYALTSYPTLPVGQGFFMSPSDVSSITFAGPIPTAVGSANSMPLDSPYANYLIASAVPYSGAVSSGTSSGGGPNLNGVPDTSVLLIWNLSGQSYDSYTADSGVGSGWDDANGYEVAAPSLSVGQGFFLAPSDVYTWTTGL